MLHEENTNVTIVLRPGCNRHNALTANSAEAIPTIKAPVLATNIGCYLDTDAGAGSGVTCAEPAGLCPCWEKRSYSSSASLK